MAHPLFADLYLYHVWFDPPSGNLESTHSTGISSSSCSRSISGRLLCLCRHTVGKCFKNGVYNNLIFTQAYAWDWLMALPEELSMFSKRGSKLTLAAYFLSRWVIWLWQPGECSRCEWKRFGTFGSVISVTVYRGYFNLIHIYARASHML